MQELGGVAVEVVVVYRLRSFVSGENQAGLRMIKLVTSSPARIHDKTKEAD